MFCFCINNHKSFISLYKSVYKKLYFIFPPKGHFYLTVVARLYSFGHKSSAHVKHPNELHGSVQ